MKVQQIVLAARPEGNPEESNFRIEEVELHAPQAGEVLLKNLYFSVDPYMRGRMNDAKSYIPPFQLNEPITGYVVAKVLESKDENFRLNDLVIGILPWAKEFVVSTKGLQKIDHSLAPASYYLGILGMPGLTAYFGLLDIGKPKGGETVVVSGAAGAVGIVVGQIAKIKECRVVGIAGSEDKVNLLKKRFGYDEVINYKTSKDLSQDIALACPKGIDVYFDNVGGEISDAVLKHINFHARIPLCGEISSYNSKEIPMGPRIQTTLLTRSVLMQGFIIGNYKSRFAEGIAQLASWTKEGRLTYTETIIDGFDQLPKAFLGLFKGENIGKMIVKG